MFEQLLFHLFVFILFILYRVILQFNYSFEVKLLTNTGKLSLDKGIAIFVSAFFPKLHGQEPKDSPDLIILDI